MPQQLKLVEDQQKARGVAARVDTIELVSVVHVLHTGARHMIFCAGNRSNALIEPAARPCNRFSLSLR